MGASAFCLSCPSFLVVGVDSISVPICSIFLNLFLVSIEGFGVGLWYFSFSFVLEVDLCFLYLVIHFFGRICCFIFSRIVFGAYFFYWLFWSFMVSVLMWVVVSSESIMSIGLKLLDNGIGALISVFGLVWTFLDFGQVSHIHLGLLKSVPWLSLL